MYRCVTLVLDPPQPASEIFIAALAELGFESFEETETGLRAYVRESDWDPEAFAALPYLDSPTWQVSYTVEALETQNWNAVWEASYQPIRVGEQCVVRAPFHPEPDPPVPYDLVIAPKMSFGTGHHQTTWLMLGFLLDINVEGLSVLDMGSGTGVLAILAARKGAGPVTAIDLDPWCYENCRENAERNGHPEIAVLEGDASKTTAGDWLANSDGRIKTDVQTITDALQKIEKVRLVSFKYSEDYREQHPSIEEKRYFNVIAQEFREIFPDYVKSSKEKLSNGDEILQVDAYPLTVYSAAAVQELLTLVKSKDAKIAQLKERLWRK